VTNLEALSRVRQVFSNWEPGSPLQVDELRAALEIPLADASREAERFFAQGWLCWLLGEPQNAEVLLEQAVRHFEQAGASDEGSEAAYWLARVRLRLGRPEQIAAFERVLRSRSGSPRITCWFVDLLWRAGQLERAEQVWKAVRSNRKVTATEEAALLEARLLLHHQEAARAERVLGEAAIRNGVLQVERDLLVVWALVALKQPTHVAALLDLARQGPYPPGVVAAWQTICEVRQQPTSAPEVPLPDPAFLASWQRGQQLRQEGRLDEARATFREALAVPLVRPFARYALACLGQDDWAGILTSQPGLFLTIRCRTQLVAQRFRQRKASAAEMLDALRQAEKHGFRLAQGDELHALASILKQSSATVDELRALVETDTEEPAVRRNRLRIALELAAHRLSPSAALPLLLSWAQAEVSAADEGLKGAPGDQLLRLAVSGKTPSTTEKAALDAAQQLLGPDPRIALARAWLQPHEQAIDLSETPTDDVLAHLWRAALRLARGVPEAEAPGWRNEVGELGKASRCQGLAQALLVQEAAQRGDVPGLAGLLEEAEPWTAFPAGPPRFVLRVLEEVARSQPRSQRLRQSLARWLGNWNLAILEPPAGFFAVYAGLIPLNPNTAEPPSGIPLLPWLLHQAAQAVSREKFTEALTWIRRALAQGPSALEERVHAALPDLERLARSQALAAVLRFHPDQPVSSPGLLAGFVALLEGESDGQAILSAALQGKTETARQLLSSLANRPALTPPLAHHLALAYHRGALFLEDREPQEAEACWDLAWRCWLAVLAHPLIPDPSSLSPAHQPEAQAREGYNPRLRFGLVSLLRLHRQQISDLLIRNEVDRARRHWERVHGLAKRAAEFSPSLAPILVEAATTFREDLATEYLTATREAMRHGDIAPGWHADYEKGLAYLRRLLSLDRDNLRLLTALVEICTEWFLDCYNNEDARRLWEQVERFTPFALKLARMIENRSDALTARAALSDFYKFRGFTAEGRQQKIALYREALKFNPANENARELLAEMEQMP
jgi:hypothetical protein